MSVPITALMATTMSDDRERQLEGRQRLGRGHGGEERSSPPEIDCHMQRRDRDEDDEPEVERREAGAQEAPAVVAPEAPGR